MSKFKRSDPVSDQVSVRPLPGPGKPVRGAFPGPEGAAAELRVAVDREPYAELIAHAKASLDAEVCGVLAGVIGADEHGEFVHVQAVIRGNAATQGATHVTFTQATWDAIHQALERDHPKQRIVGWYHTHPGFGVEFSDMDLFIQRNFFSGATQIALVTDPLSGAIAIAVNTPEGIGYLSRFWVDGREQFPKSPARATPGRGTPAPAGEPADELGRSVKALEARVGQLIQAHDEQRALFHRVVLGAGLMFCAGIIVAVGYLVYSQYFHRIEPPRLNSFVPVPVQVGDKTVLLGVGILEWNVPPELNAAFLRQEQLNREAAAKGNPAGTVKPPDGPPPPADQTEASNPKPVPPDPAPSK